MTLADFFGSLGIPGMGRTRWKKIVEHTGLTEFSDFAPIDISEAGVQESDFETIPGFSTKSAFAIYGWLRENWREIEKLAKHMRFQKAKKASSDGMAGQVVCFTGDGGMKRDKLTSIAIDNGAVVRTSVTSDLTLLVCADMDSLSSKARKAREKGVKLVSVDEFLSKCEWEV